MPGLCCEHAYAEGRDGEWVRWVGAVRDYCLFIRGLSFGEFSGCAYLRNDGNPLAIFYTLPPSVRLASTATGNATEARSGGSLFMTARLRCDEDHLRTKEEKKKEKEEERGNSYEILIAVSVCILRRTHLRGRWPLERSKKICSRMPEEFRRDEVTRHQEGQNGGKDPRGRERVHVGKLSA